MADPKLGNFQSCCRLCLCEKMDTLKSVFDEAVEDRTLPQKILQFVAVEVSEFVFVVSSIWVFGVIICGISASVMRRLSYQALGCNKAACA